MNKKVTHRALKLDEIGNADCAIIGAKYDHKTGLMHFLDIRDMNCFCKSEGFNNDIDVCTCTCGCEEKGKPGVIEMMGNVHGNFPFSSQPQVQVQTSISFQDRLYETLDRNNTVKIRVPFNPMLLSTLGQFNCLKEEHKPELADVERYKNLIAAAPELLEALSNLIYMSRKARGGECSVRDLDSALTKAIYIRSKAKGE